MESNKRRLILRTILTVFLITAAIGIIGALASQQGAMGPTPTVTSSLGAIPAVRGSRDGDTARCARGTRDAARADGNTARCAYGSRRHTRRTGAMPPVPALTAEAGLLATLTNTTNRQGARTAQAGLLASLTATAYLGQDNPGSYATEHPPTPVPTATLAPCPADAKSSARGSFAGMYRAVDAGPLMRARAVHPQECAVMRRRSRCVTAASVVESELSIAQSAPSD